MKKFFTKNKIKYITATCLSVLIIGTIFGIASIFLNNKPVVKNEDKIEYDEFISISIENEMRQQNLNYLLDDKETKKFSKENVKNNLMRLSKNSIDNCSDFKSENINNYDLKLRYFINKELNNIKVNIFMYNKLIKNKKFKTFYRLYII